MIVVSACLAGLNCRYDGKNMLDPEIARMVLEGQAISVCPECLGGLKVPRPPAEIKEGTGADVLDGRCNVMNIEGEDVTSNYLTGAYMTLDLAKSVNADKAILKKKSPSCGTEDIYNGAFTGDLRKGKGVTAELLQRNSIKIEGR